MLVPQRAVKGSRGTEAGRPLLNDALQPQNLFANQAAVSIGQGPGFNATTAIGAASGVGGSSNTIVGLGGSTGAGQISSMAGDVPHVGFVKSASTIMGLRASFTLGQTAAAGLLTRGILPPVAQTLLPQQGPQREGQQDLPVRVSLTGIPTDLFAS
jgi:hypothetical protein